MPVTIQNVTADSKECGKFLRKVVRDNLNSSYGNGWRIRFSAATGWKARFERTVKGAIGEPDSEIEVQTDFAVTMPADSRFGTIASFADSLPVVVSRPVSVWVDGSDAATLAKLLADGSRLALVCSSGSTNSSKIGLSFYSLEAAFPGIPYGAVTIGSQTVAKDGQTIVCGAVSLR